jgi:DNA-directed RNA polymerase specialized sigma24 family protein
VAPDPKLVVDYEQLIGRLTQHACHVLGVVCAVAPTYVVDGLGKSPEDFALDVVNLYVTDKLKFSGDQEALFPFLAKVMGRDILDGLRSSARRTTTKVPALAAAGKDDESLGSSALENRDSGFCLDDLMEGGLLKERLYALLEKTEPKLYEVVYAIFEFNALTTREIADVIGTTRPEIENRKKRLRTFLAKHNFRRKSEGSSR